MLLELRLIKKMKDLLLAQTAALILFSDVILPFPFPSKMCGK